MLDKSFQVCKCKCKCYRPRIVDYLLFLIASIVVVYRPYTFHVFALLVLANFMANQRFKKHCTALGFSRVCRKRFSG